MENLTSNHVETFLNNIMVGVNRHPCLLSRIKIQLQNSIALSAKLSINMAFVLQILLLIFHTRDEVQKFEYTPNHLSLGTPFKLH